jgi:hypothetical protein
LTKLAEEYDIKTTKDAKEKQNNIVITGKPWIDGIIWGRGSPLSLSKIRLNITYMPAPMIEKVLDELNNQYEVKIVKMLPELDDNEEEILPINDIGTESVFMYVSSNEPIFRNLPKRRGERKISVDNDIEFIEGYLQSIMCSMGKNDLRIHPVKTAKKDISKILTFLQIEFCENSALFYVKNATTRSNPILKRYVSYLDEENRYFRSEEEILDEDVRIKESICFSKNRLRRRNRILKKRKLAQLSDDELINMIFDKSNKVKKRALEEIRYRKNSESYISEGIQEIYQKKFPNMQDNHMLIEKRIEAEIIGILFEWDKLEILYDLYRSFIYKSNRDLAYKYVKTLRRKSNMAENQRIDQKCAL